MLDANSAIGFGQNLLFLFFDISWLKSFISFKKLLLSSKS